MISTMVSRLVCWARGGYPRWASRQGHVALIALCGQDASPTERKPRLSD